ncbi:MAG: COG3014 family protein, partial [Planctomycetota bacterium]
NEFTKSNVESPETAELLTQKYPNLRNFEAYPDFINPFATYLAGVFFNLVSDHAKAVDLIKESYGMVGDNGYIAEDLSVTEDILDGKGRLEDTIWLIFENGLGPAKKELRMDIPLFVATDNIKYVGIALPELYFRNKAHQHMVAEVDGTDYETRLVCDMDRVIQTEFSKDYPGILTRAIISATAKAIAQYALEKQDSSESSIASIFMAAYTYATTAADVRIWTSLPKEFQVARFPKPEKGILKVKRPSSDSIEINIPDCNNAIVYVRIINDQAEPVFEVMTF